MFQACNGAEPEVVARAWLHQWVVFHYSRDQDVKDAHPAQQWSINSPPWSIAVSNLGDVGPTFIPDVFAGNAPGVTEPFFLETKQ